MIYSGACNPITCEGGFTVKLRIIFSAISFALTLFGFLYGAFHLFREKKPLYFKLIVASAGCFAFEQLSLLVNYLTDGYYYITLGKLGIFGSLLFLLSAEYGSLDRLVDDGAGTKKYRTAALIAPALCIFALALIFYFAYPLGIVIASLTVFILLPSVPASYFTLKHIILPTDALGFSKATRAGNICTLAFCLLLFASDIALLYDSIFGNVFTVLTALLSALISIFAVRGERSWKELI